MRWSITSRAALATLTRSDARASSRCLLVHVFRNDRRSANLDDRSLAAVEFQLTLFDQPSCLRDVTSEAMSTVESLLN
jgi:hypothetical protein